MTNADAFSADAYYASAREFALSALEAHHAGNRRRVPIDAATAIEHLAKACLAKRSPALLAELKNSSSVHSLIALLRLDGGVYAGKIRTVGLSDALIRVGLFVKSPANGDDLQELVDVRNGVVHAAQDPEVEERILTAFVQQTDCLLQDIGRGRADFWAGQINVVDALLSDASDKLIHRVELRLAAARAMLQGLYENEGKAFVRALRVQSKSVILQPDEHFHVCPVCESLGIARGKFSIETLPAERSMDTATGLFLVLFNADKFHCRVCGLRLDSEAELDAAGLRTVWEPDQPAKYAKLPDIVLPQEDRITTFLDWPASGTGEDPGPPQADAH